MPEGKLCKDCAGKGWRGNGIRPSMANKCTACLGRGRVSVEEKVDPKPPMTLGALSTTVGLVLRDLDLTGRSYRRSSAYHDYVACQFIVPHFTPANVEKIKVFFRELLTRHGWTELSVTSHALTHSVSVTISQSSMISSDGSRRMPM